eukprot:421801-Ditylum_brightwellii.AAC.1
MTLIPPSDNDKDDNKEESFEHIEERTHYVYVRIIDHDDNVGTGNFFTDRLDFFPLEVKQRKPIHIGVI